ncbi:unnamed protein product [Timema podura]|uniref:Lon N-terminal domain-containing protein n=1 Tax=Timema podura TaxID=61482 RepID=A0ABN7PAN7_TIMPD|nr:unnamed protein product [Timema podura]
MQDMGDRLRLVVMAHRRIRIVDQIIDNTEPVPADMIIKFPLFNTSIAVSVEESDLERRRRKRRKKRPLVVNALEGDALEGEVEEKKEDEMQGEVSGPEVQEEGTGPQNATPPFPKQQPVLMVEVENVNHDKFRQTEEVKALTQEVIKTIRDIISMNPLYRESLQQMLNQGQRVVDNPVYLSDLGAALTGAEPAELQQSAGGN